MGNKKVKIVTSVILVLVLITLIVGILALNGNLSKLGSHNNETAQANETENQSTNTIDTTNWDTEKVNIVQSADGISVPVPKGFVMSGADSEKYVNGRDVEHTGTATALTWTSEGTYPWAENSDGIWVSGNAGVASSTSTITSDFTVGENEGQFVMEFSVSCQASYSDYLTITLTSNETGEVTIERRTGTDLGTSYDGLTYLTYNKKLDAGSYTIQLSYYKNLSTDIGADSSYIKSAKVVSYDETGAETVTEHINGGLVIYEGETEVTNDNAWEESKTRNQFVWVPVDDPSEIYEVDSTTGNKKSKLYNYSSSGKTSYTNSNYEPGIVWFYDNEKYFSKYNLKGLTKEKLLEQLETEYEETIESIEKYGGFYIGRYETGNVGTSYKVPVVRRMNTNIESVTWYDAYRDMPNITSNENVKVNMIWGNLWDETLDWLVKSGATASDGTQITYSIIGSDSTLIGNYYNNSITYTTTDGSTATTTASSRKRIPAGSSENTKTNNIYDMAGNVWEWTLEAYSGSYRRFRGGDSYRNNDQPRLSSSQTQQRHLLSGPHHRRDRTEYARTFTSNREFHGFRA